MYRWWAVIVGFIGILVMLAPHFDPAHYATAAASATTVGIDLRARAARSAMPAR